MSLRCRKVCCVSALSLFFCCSVDLHSGGLSAAHARKRKTKGRKYVHIRHRVKKGQTLSHIAKRYRVSTKALKKWNKLQGNLVRAGRVMHMWLPADQVKKRPRRWRGRYPDPVQLQDGFGYRVKKGRTAWGRAGTISHLREAIERTIETFPGTDAIFIGDISTRRGGRLPPHKSHRSGQDVDIAYYIKGAEQPQKLKRVRWRQLDAERTWFLLNELLKTGHVKWMYIDHRLQRPLYEEARRSGMSQERLLEVFQYPRPRWQRRGIIRHIRGHATHVHIRFNCPLATEPSS